MTVSIVMPTKDRVGYVERAIKSVLTQTYPDWELLIVDDSTKETHRRILDLVETDHRLRLVPRKPGVGPCTARRMGVEASRGPFVTFIDSDDYYLPDRLLQHMKVWQSNPRIGLSYDSWSSSDLGEEDYVKRQIEWIPEGTSDPPLTARRMFNGNFIHASSGFTTKRIIQLLGGYPETPLVCDWYLYIRICERYAVHRIGQPLSIKDSRAPGRIGVYQSSLVTREFMLGRRKILFNKPTLYGKLFLKELLLFVPASIKNRDGQYLRNKVLDLAYMFRP